MKILVKFLLILCAAGLGLGLGFVVRGKSLSISQDLTAANSDSSAESSASKSRESKKNTHAPAIDDSPLATKLERDLSMSRGVTRWLYWLEALEKAALTDLPRLARLAEGNSTIARLIADRWLELNPRNLFDTVAAMSTTGRGKVWDELANTLFSEWPKRDPDAAIAALNEPGNLGTRSTWRHNVVTTVFDQDVERGLRLFAEWHIENYGPNMKSVIKWAAADPKHAAEFTLANPTGFASRLTMETVGKEWAKIDPARALEFASTQQGELSQILANNVLKEWASRDLKDAANWLTATDASTRNRLSPSFVEAWAKQDAAAALNWCDANLSGSTLSQAIGAALKGAANKDVAAAAALVSGMSPSEARSTAAAAVAEKWFPEFTSGKPVKPEALAWLAQLDSPSIKNVLEKITWNWTTSDPKSMAAFLSSATADQIPTYSASTLARELAHKNPAEAMEWATHLPGDFAQIAGGSAFSEWRSSQSDAAMKWLHDLPASDSRRQPYFENAVRDLCHHPQAAEQLAAMDATDRAAARSVVEKMSIPADRRSRLLDALKSPGS
jgi:hypothetical protein